MNKIKQYRPNLVTTTEENKIVSFETTEELLNIDFVKNFSNRDNFYRFSLSIDNYFNQHSLMAEYDEGREWWVVGFIDNPLEVNLPKWMPKEK